MANLPPNSNIPTNNTVAGGRAIHQRILSPEQLILNLYNPNLRENALLELAKHKDRFQDLALWLWHSFGIVAILLQELVAIHFLTSPDNLTSAQANKVCNVLALLQCIANHQDTKKLFITANIPVYIYPFLDLTSKVRPFEYLRLASLGVVGALVKVDDTEVISFLLSTEIIPKCMNAMENGSELSKIVAAFIIHKVLLDDAGLNYVCTTPERFYSLCKALGNMVAEQPSTRLLKHIIRCYLRLSHNARTLDDLKNCLPIKLKNGTFNSILQDDMTTRGWLQQLLQNIQGPRTSV